MLSSSTLLPHFTSFFGVELVGLTGLPRLNEKDSSSLSRCLGISQDDVEQAELGLVIADLLRKKSSSLVEADGNGCACSFLLLSDSFVGGLVTFRRLGPVLLSARLCATPFCWAASGFLRALPFCRGRFRQLRFSESPHVDPDIFRRALSGRAELTLNRLVTFPYFTFPLGARFTCAEGLHRLSKRISDRFLGGV